MNGLHPDLVDYVQDDLVHHPLIIERLYGDVIKINNRYLYKKADCEAARAAGDWEKFLWLHERAYRIDALVVFHSLAPTNLVWRGTAHKRSAQGLSWTLQRDKAEWFAKRFSSERNPPLLVSATVTKDDVLAYFDGRGEFEIVSHQVSVNTIEKL